MKPVLFSVSYGGFWGQDKLSLEEFIPHAASMGYHGIEIMCKRPHLSPLDWNEEKISSINKLCQDNKISVECLAGYTNFMGGLETPEVPFIEMQIMYTGALIKIANALDCKLVRVFTSYERDDIKLYDQWNRTVAAIRECCDIAKDYNINIGIQNHHDLAVHSKVLLEFLLDINRPNCKLMYDAWSPCLRGEELYETAKSMAPYTVYTTFADYIRLPRYRYQQSDLTNYLSMPVDMARAVPMGDGEMDNVIFLKGLKDGGFDGSVAYEMCSQLRGGGSMENLDYCAKRFLQWMKENGFI